MQYIELTGRHVALIGRGQVVTTHVVSADGAWRIPEAGRMYENGVRFYYRGKEHPALSELPVLDQVAQ